MGGLFQNNHKNFWWRKKTVLFSTRDRDYWIRWHRTLKKCSSYHDCYWYTYFRKVSQMLTPPSAQRWVRQRSPLWSQLNTHHTHRRARSADYLSDANSDRTKMALLRSFNSFHTCGDPCNARTPAHTRTPL